jgi:hypothetical protein
MSADQRRLAVQGFDFERVAGEVSTTDDAEDTDSFYVFGGRGGQDLNRCRPVTRRGE